MSEPRYPSHAEQLRTQNISINISTMTAKSSDGAPAALLTHKPRGTDTEDVLSFIYQCVLERNASETEPFAEVHSSNLALRNTVDNLQYQCTVLQKEKAEQDRIIDQLTEELDASNGADGGGGGGGKGGPSKTEARQREKIEKLQEQLNDDAHRTELSSTMCLVICSAWRCTLSFAIAADV